MVLFNTLLGGVDKRVHTILKGISRKVNAIVRLKFERTYYDVTGSG